MLSFEKFISQAFPKGETSQVLHLQSVPRLAPNILVNSEKEGIENITIKTHHLVTVAQNDVILLGLEIYVYIIINKYNHFVNNDPVRKLLYLSKVDSTGLGKKFKITKVVQQILKYLIRLEVNHFTDGYLVIPESSKGVSSMTTTQKLKILIENQNKKLPESNVTFHSLRNIQTLHNKPVVTEISLFTRAENQYLFPSSHLNSGKHVLSDNDLLSWWLYSLNQIVRDPETFESSSNSMTIPGEDKYTILRFINKLNPPGEKKLWHLGGSFDLDGIDKKNCIHYVPLLPDDPKGRFLEHLSIEGRAHKVTLAQFWNELAVRQEFRLTSIVGIIKVSGAATKSSKIINNRPMQDKKLNKIIPIHCKVSELHSYGIIVNNFKSDVIIVTPQCLLKLKDFMTGEDYSELDGGKAAFQNLSHSLQTACGYNDFSEPDLSAGFRNVVGKWEKLESSLKRSAPPITKPVQILAVKKRKKVKP